MKEEKQNEKNSTLLNASAANWPALMAMENSLQTVLMCCPKDKLKSDRKPIFFNIF